MKKLSIEDVVFIALVGVMTVGGLWAIGFLRTLAVYAITALGCARFRIGKYEIALGDSAYFWLFAGFAVAILVLTAC